MRLNREEGNNQAMESRLDALLASYREACPDPEVAPDFMPRLWQKIEARRSSALSLRKWTQAFVTAAAAICLLFGILLTTSNSPMSPVYDSTYLEVLAADQAAGIYPDIELVSVDNGGWYRQ